MIHVDINSADIGLLLFAIERRADDQIVRSVSIQIASGHGEPEIGAAMRAFDCEVEQFGHLTKANIEHDGHETSHAVELLARRTRHHQAQLGIVQVASDDHVRHARVAVLLPQVRTVAVTHRPVVLDVEFAQALVAVDVLGGQTGLADCLDADQAAKVERTWHAKRHVSVLKVAR